MSLFSNGREGSPHADVRPRSATVSSRHVRGGPRLVDEDEPFRIEVELRSEPLTATLQDIRPLLLGRVRGLFFNVIPLRAKKRDSAEVLNERPLAARAAHISARVASPPAPSSERMKSLSASIAAERRSPPCGLGAISPVVSARATQRIALDVPTLKCTADCRRDIPPTTAAKTR